MVAHGTRFRGFDGFRAVSVTIVLLSHLPIALASLGRADWYEVFPNAGFLGVNMFFVLSGFLIAHRLLATARDDGSLRWRRFWVSRSARILPALVAFLAVHVVYATATGFPPDGNVGDEVLMVVSSIFQFANYAILADIDNLFDNGALWSLSVEGHFYVLAPFLVWLVARRRSAVPPGLVILCVAVALLSWHRREVFGDLGSFSTYLRTDTRIESILIGAIGGMAFARTNIFNPRVLTALTFPAVVAMAAIYAQATQQSEFIWNWAMTLFDLCTLVVIAGLAAGSSPLTAALEWTPLAWLGGISYAVYIWQVPVLQLLLRHADQWPDIVKGACALSLIAVISAASQRYVEDPVRRSAIVSRLAGR
ncbi:MAG: acyltransferase family protein [Ilumatobacteraceae bacterium]